MNKIAIIVGITLLIVVGISYFFTKNKSQNIISFTTPSDFTAYNSPIGFSISYPIGWTTKETKGVDTSFGGVQILSQGTSIKYDSYSNGDKLEQLVRVGGGAALEPLSYEKIKNNYKSNIEKQNSSSFSRKVISERDIKVNGVDAYEIVFTENNITNKTSTKNILVVLLADPISKKYDQLGTFIEIGYTARQDVFDQALAEKIIGTFRENILQTYVKKIEEAKKPEARALNDSYARVQTALKNLNSGTSVVIYEQKQSYESICSNGLLNTSTEYIQGYVDMIYQGLKVSSQTDASIKCFATKDKLVVSARTSDNKMWCVQTDNYRLLSGTADNTSMSCK